MAVGPNQRYHFGEGEFTTHFRTYFEGVESDVHWGVTRHLTYGHIGLSFFEDTPRWI